MAAVLVVGLLVLGMTYLGIRAGNPAAIGIGVFLGFVDVVLATREGPGVAVGLFFGMVAVATIAWIVFRARRSRLWKEALTYSCWLCDSKNVEIRDDGTGYDCRDCAFSSDMRQTLSATVPFRRLEEVDILLETTSSLLDRYRGLSSFGSRFAGEFSSSFVTATPLGVANNDDYEPIDEAFANLERLWGQLRQLREEFPDDAARLLGSTTIEEFCEQSAALHEHLAASRTSVIEWAQSGGREAREQGFTMLEELHSEANSLRVEVVSAASLLIEGA